MTVEETIIEMDKVISMIHESNKTEQLIYIGSDSEFNEKEYRGFRVYKFNVVPKKTVYIGNSIFYK